MSKLHVEGGQPLAGVVHPQGAKNEALQVIVATLLTEEPVTLRNVPRIADVEQLLLMLQQLGATVAWPDEHTCCICTAGVTPEVLRGEGYSHRAAKLRGSVLLVGPLLARFGQGFVARPGGDKIGRRRLDTHLQGFVNLGATLESDARGEGHWVRGRQLKGTYMLLDEASVTGTANIIMAATAAEGKTTIFNAACEPYVQQLCRMLIAMGAEIDGVGSNLLTIHGGHRLHGCTHTLLPDMIEVGSFIGLAALTGGEITIANAGCDALGPIPMQFQRLGVQLERRNGDDIYIAPNQAYAVETFIDGSIMTIADAPWPGLTPDLLSVMLVVATQARGTVLIHQKMFESRLFFVDRLIEMGAQIILCDPHRATVIGLGKTTRLRGGTMASPDIRAGVALLIAALAAEGESVIDNAEQIDRGYENIEARLNALGAKITRKE
ncbi:MAG: UDP-N-acetylglucosamine 1-carboxyvinyltransferase [Bacteroidia bacterium]|nr:UDP-N-acetylglucosamine 1-carboxyvinyltransferase [Bacteroidia bacterium]